MSLRELDPGALSDPPGEGKGPQLGRLDDGLENLRRDFVWALRPRLGRYQRAHPFISQPVGQTSDRVAMNAECLRDLNPAGGLGMAERGDGDRLCNSVIGFIEVERQCAREDRHLAILSEQ